RSHTCPDPLCPSFFSSYRAHRDLHSFPTRRSSDLRRHHRRRHRGLQRRLPPRQARLQGRAAARAAAADVRNHLARRGPGGSARQDRKSTRLNSSHVKISYAVFCLKKKKKKTTTERI